jgi:hypothetical protein
MNRRNEISVQKLLPNSGSRRTSVKHKVEQRSQSRCPFLGNGLVTKCPRQRIWQQQQRNFCERYSLFDPWVRSRLGSRILGFQVSS